MELRPIEIRVDNLRERFSESWSRATAAEVKVPSQTRSFRSRTVRLSAICVGSLLVCYALMLATRNVATLVDLQADRFDGTVAQGQFEDYVAFYAAGELVRQGRGGDIYDIDALAATEREIMSREVGGTGVLAFFNPPFVALFFAPLTLVSVATAGLVLMLGNIVLVAVAAFILHRQLEIRERWVSLAFWLAVVSFESVFWLVAHNQLSMFLVFGFLGFFVLQKQGKLGLSGLALSLLLVKPQAALLIFVVLIWKRQWAALGSFSVVAVTLVLASIAVAGPSALWEYPQFLAQSTSWEGSRGVDTQGMYGWNGFISTLTSYGGTTHLLATAVASLGILGAIAYSLRGRWQPSSDSFPLIIGVLALGSLLLNPHAYLQDTVLIALVLVLGLLAWRTHAKGLALWIALSITAWFLVSRTMELQAESNLNLLTPFAATLFLVMAGSAMIRGSSETSPTPKTSIYEVPDSQSVWKQMPS